jgi:hypothetical protein
MNAVFWDVALCSSGVNRRHSATSQKTPLFVATAVKTSNSFTLLLLLLLLLALQQHSGQVFNYRIFWDMTPSLLTEYYQPSS